MLAPCHPMLVSLLGALEMWGEAWVVSDSECEGGLWYGAWTQSHFKVCLEDLKQGSEPGRNLWLIS